MSKAVKAVVGGVASVGRAVGSVVKGAVNLVKKVATSKIGKIVIGAAAVYLTAGAALGAIGGASAGIAGTTAGSGFWATVANGLSGAASGAASGLSTAWTGLTSAASSVAGGNFLKAGEQLVGGVGDAWDKAYNLVNSSSITGTPSLTGPYGSLAGDMAGANSAPAFSQSTLTAQDAALKASAAGTPLFPNVAAPVTTGATGGIMSNLLSGPYALPALVKAGGQLVSSVGQGYVAKQAQERQERLDAEARDRYSRNVGAPLFGTRLA